LRTNRGKGREAWLMLSGDDRMMTLRHILFPYDFSTQCSQIAPFVRALAGRSGACVTLLSVVPPAFEPVPTTMGGSQLRVGDDAAEWRLNLHNRIDRALLDELAGLRVDRLADAVSQEARQEQADLSLSAAAQCQSPSGGCAFMHLALSSARHAQS
jgi:nucleotide-binding universal stress UspA family protein